LVDAEKREQDMEAQAFKNGNTDGEGDGVEEVGKAEIGFRTARIQPPHSAQAGTSRALD
jgi:hypothetical protein